MRAMSGQMAYPLCRKGEGNGVLVGQSQTDFQVRDRRRVHLEPSAQGQRRGQTNLPENAPGEEGGDGGLKTGKRGGGEKGGDWWWPDHLKKKKKRSKEEEVK